MEVSCQPHAVIQRSSQAQSELGTDIKNRISAFQWNKMHVHCKEQVRPYI